MKAKELERKISYVLSVLRSQANLYEDLVKSVKEEDELYNTYYSLKTTFEFTISLIKDITGVEKDEEELELDEEDDEEVEDYEFNNDYEFYDENSSFLDELDLDPDTLEYAKEEWAKSEEEDRKRGLK